MLNLSTRGVRAAYAISTNNMSVELSATCRHTVLVLDADQTSALTIVRSLGQLGVFVVVASSEAHPLSGFSRHARTTLRYPDPLREEASFIAWLQERMDADRQCLVIPVTERTLLPMFRHRALLDDQRISMAPSEALEQALDKHRTVQLARELRIPVPRSVLVESSDALDAAAAGLAFPVVVKPSRSVGQDADMRVQLTVSYAQDADELILKAGFALRYGAVILQEYFRGDGVGIELIADHGKVRFAFQHRRLHEVPLTGGGSSLRVSEAIVPALRQASEQLIQAMGWHGVAMVEFKYAPATGEFRLMEINGRFWGSLPLAVAAGANFPVMLHELMTTGRITDRPLARTGVVCRHLSRDIDWLEHVLRKAAPPQLVRMPTGREVLRDSLLVFSPRHHFDVQSLRDPWPGLVDLWRIMRKQTRRITTLIRDRRRLSREWAAARPGGPGRQTMARAQKVLFLCYGNINRSALAQAYADAHHAGRFEFASAGFHAPGGRPADPVMVDIAAAKGIDMAQWQSQTLTAQMVDEADVILAMEITHLDRLFLEHPGACGKAFLLGASRATGHHNVEVADPYGKVYTTYVRILEQVIDSIDGWFSPLRDGDRLAPPVTAKSN